MDINKIVTKNVKGEMMAGFDKTFDHYQHKFNFGHFFISPVKLDLNLKFRSKFNHGFTNHDYLDCAILKALQNFMVKRVHEAIYQFLFQNVQNEIFEILNIKFTKVTC